MKRTLKKGICIATAAMMVAGMTSVTALADDTKASGKINFYYWDADQTNEVNKVIELFNEQNPDVEVVATQIPSGEYWTKLQTSLPTGTGAGCFLDEQKYSGLYQCRSGYGSYRQNRE